MRCGKKPEWVRAALRRVTALLCTFLILLLGCSRHEVKIAQSSLLPLGSINDSRLGRPAVRFSGGHEIAVADLDDSEMVGRRVFEKALASNPDNLWARLDLTDLLFENRRYIEAQQHLELFHLLPHVSHGTELRLSRIYETWGDLELALQHASHALEMRPADTDSRMLVARCQVATGRSREALLTLDEIREEAVTAAVLALRRDAYSALAREEALQNPVGQFEKYTPPPFMIQIPKPGEETEDFATKREVRSGPLDREREDPKPQLEAGVKSPRNRRALIPALPRTQLASFSSELGPLVPEAKEEEGQALAAESFAPVSGQFSKREPDTQSTVSETPGHDQRRMRRPPTGAILTAGGLGLGTGILVILAVSCGGAAGILLGGLAAGFAGLLGGALFAVHLELVKPEDSEDEVVRRGRLFESGAAHAEERMACVRFVG